jgi:hypothetical protein
VNDVAAQVVMLVIHVERELYNPVTQLLNDAERLFIADVTQLLTLDQVDDHQLVKEVAVVLIHAFMPLIELVHQAAMPAQVEFHHELIN